LAFDFDGAVGAASLAALRAAKRSAGVAGTEARRRGAIPEAAPLDIPQSNEKKKRQEGKKKYKNHGAIRFSFVQKKNGFSRPSNYCDGPMVVHGFLRTEEEQCGGNSHSRMTPKRTTMKAYLLQ